MAIAKGTKQLNVGIAEALMEELQAFVQRRDEKLRAVVEAALRRHMDNPPEPNLPPPPPVYPPLPPVTAPVSSESGAKPARRTGPRKKK